MCDFQTESGKTLQIIHRQWPCPTLPRRWFLTPACRACSTFPTQQPQLPTAHGRLPLNGPTAFHSLWEAPCDHCFQPRRAHTPCIFHGTIPIHHS